MVRFGGHDGGAGHEVELEELEEQVGGCADMMMIGVHWTHAGGALTHARLGPPLTTHLSLFFKLRWLVDAPLQLLWF